MTVGKKYSGGRFFLNDMRQATEARVNFLRARDSLAQLEKRATRTPQGTRFLRAFRSGGPHVLAEIKRASPSAGKIAGHAEPVSTAKSYLENGATGLSVLTESQFFDGDLKHLEKVRQQFPDALLLRKDFICDESQLLESQAAGADAVLLIVAFLEPSRFVDLFEAAKERKFAVLVEVHDEDELEFALKLRAPLIGINNRNLQTLTVSLAVSERLSTLFRGNGLFLSESGIETGAQLKALAARGFCGGLIGSALMSQGDPGKALRQLLEEARP